MPRNVQKRAAVTETRRNRVLQLRLNGGTYRQIAAVVGISIAQVHRDLRNRLDIVRTEGEEMARHYRAVQLERYEAMLRTWMPRAGERQEEIDEPVEIDDPQAPGGKRTVMRKRTITIPPDPKAALIVLRTNQQIDQLLGIRIPVPDEVHPPDPVDLTINLVPTGALEQIEDQSDTVTDVEAVEVTNGTQ